MPAEKNLFEDISLHDGGCEFRVSGASRLSHRNNIIRSFNDFLTPQEERRGEQNNAIPSALLSAPTLVRTPSRAALVATASWANLQEASTQQQAPTALEAHFGRDKLRWAKPLPRFDEVRKQICAQWQLDSTTLVLKGLWAGSFEPITCEEDLQVWLEVMNPPEPSPTTAGGGYFGDQLASLGLGRTGSYSSVDSSGMTSPTIVAPVPISRAWSPPPRPDTPNASKAASSGKKRQGQQQQRSEVSNLRPATPKSPPPPSSMTVPLPVPLQLMVWGIPAQPQATEVIEGLEALCPLCQETAIEDMEASFSRVVPEVDLLAFFAAPLRDPATVTGFSDGVQLQQLRTQRELRALTSCIGSREVVPAARFPSDVLAYLKGESKVHPKWIAFSGLLS